MNVSKAELRVLSYLDEHDSITQKEANDFLGCSRLAAVICRLKKKGAPIDSEYISVTNRFGETCRVKRYFYEHG